MAFCVNGSDYWGIDVGQEKFISEYFGLSVPDCNYSNKLESKERSHSFIENIVKSLKTRDLELSNQKTGVIKNSSVLNNGVKATGDKTQAQANFFPTEMSSSSLPKVEVRKRKPNKRNKYRAYTSEDHQANKNPVIIPVNGSAHNERNTNSTSDLKKSTEGDSQTVQINVKKRKRNHIKKDLVIVDCSDKCTVAKKRKSKKVNNKVVQDETIKSKSSSDFCDQKTNDMFHFTQSVENLSNKDNAYGCIEKAKKNLQAAKFRLLNEKLYNITGQEAFSYFKKDLESFNIYHQGYQMQVKKWPVNPVDLIIQDLKTKSSSLIVADLGCGDAKIARSFPSRQIHSFDLVALNRNVTSCDISKVPLPNDSVDIAIFCLSLMGKNLSQYVWEARRILKDGGILRIAEVESRIANLSNFKRSVEAYGFSLLNEDISNKMFVMINFMKVKRKSQKRTKLPTIELSPCVYKKR